MQFDVITVDVGEMLADLGDAYGKWHLGRAGCIRQTRGQREGLGALGCTRRGRSTHQYRSRSVRPGQLSRRRALESLTGCLERGAASWVESERASNLSVCHMCVSEQRL